MNAIQHTYNGLLQDVANSSGIRSIAETSWDSDWLLYKSYLVERELLRCIETGSNMDSYTGPLQDLIRKAGSTKNPSLVRYARQLLLFAYKAKETHNATSIEKATQKWVANNDSCRVFDDTYRFKDDAVLRRARSFIQDVLQKANFRDIVPYHGPGAVYDKTASCKGDWKVRNLNLDALYPYCDFFSTHRAGVIGHYYDDYYHRCSDLIDRPFRARICAVPKDARGPRLIAVHDQEAIWIQQGQWRAIECAIDRSSGYMKPKFHISFTDQTKNQRLALASSRTRKYATLDLADASDRLSRGLVSYLFGDSYKFLEVSRAQHMDISGSLHCIHSYAPMGNATTFPVQSLVYWALCVSLLISLGYKKPKAVWVFGDDLIVPASLSREIMIFLHQYNLQVNTHKCYSEGFFRESCGVDALMGVDVTPLRWKLPMSPTHDPASLTNLCNLAMRLRLAGYTDASVRLYSYLRDTMRSVYGQKLFLTNNPDHGGIAEYTGSAVCAFEDAFWHHRLHCYVSRVHRSVTRSFEQSHDSCHILTSLSSLERTGEGCDPAWLDSTTNRLIRGWTHLVTSHVEIRDLSGWLLLAEKLHE